MTNAISKSADAALNVDSSVEAQARAVLNAALSPACSKQVQAQLLGASKTLENLAARLKHTKKRRTMHVRTLPACATPPELRRARREGGVRRGNLLYLPEFPDFTYPLPNVFLRSALFRSSEFGEGQLDDYITTQGQSAIHVTGPALFDYDRQVLAALIRRLSIEEPCTDSDVSKSLVLSFWQCARMLGLTYGRNQHCAIKASLMRLSGVQLRVNVGGEVISVNGLLHAKFLGAASKGSDLVELCVPAALFELFGEGQWTAISIDALHHVRGLTRWLTWYYRTHSAPYPLKVRLLRELSGSACDLREFRRRLKNALAALQRAEVDDSVRVAGFIYEAKADTMTVYMERWNVAVPS